VVHTGARVALNSVGIATFEPTTPQRIAANAAGKIDADNACHEQRLHGVGEQPLLARAARANQS
jgi:hypothetical protein